MSIPLSDKLDPTDQWHQSVPKSVSGYTIPGVLVILLAFGGFGWWAVTAPLSSAAVARGIFVATGQNKVIQHLEGGIIRKILVSEGEKVEPDQVLVELAGTQAQADVNRLELKFFTLRAHHARLEAERLGRDKLVFPVSLLKSSKTDEHAQVLKTQKEEFAARQNNLRDERGVIEKRISAIREEIDGIEALRTSNSGQAALLEEELKDAKHLLDQGLMQKTRYLQLKRALVSLEGENANYAARIAQAKQRISEAETQISQLESKYREDSVAAYGKVQTEMEDVEERLVAAHDILKRQSVISPSRGVVLKLHFHTAGAVIGPGQPILELLPTDEQLVIEAYVRPEDIDSVYKGLEAEVRLVALKQRTTPLVKGKVIYVSADAIRRKDSKELFYEARILLDAESLQGNKEIKLAPGMPAEVYIQTGERTFLDYIINPITASFQRAFREE